MKRVEIHTKGNSLRYRFAVVNRERLLPPASPTCSLDLLRVTWVRHRYIEAGGSRNSSKQEAAGERKIGGGGHVSLKFFLAVTARPIEVLHVLSYT